MIESLKVRLLPLAPRAPVAARLPRCPSLTCSNVGAQVCDVKHADLHQLQWMLSERSACPPPRPLPRASGFCLLIALPLVCARACREEEVLCLQHAAKQQQLQVLTQQEQLLELRAENRQVVAFLCVSLCLSPPRFLRLSRILTLSLSLSARLCVARSSGSRRRRTASASSSCSLSRSPHSRYRESTRTCLFQPYSVHV